MRILPAKSVVKHSVQGGQGQPRFGLGSGLHHHILLWAGQPTWGFSKRPAQTQLDPLCGLEFLGSVSLRRLRQQLQHPQDAAVVILELLLLWATSS